METYTFLRQLADSWVLLIMTGVFLGVIGWAFRPGSRAMHDDAANIPFRYDDMEPSDAVSSETCPDAPGATPEGPKEHVDA